MIAPAASAPSGLAGPPVPSGLAPGAGASAPSGLAGPPVPGASGLAPGALGAVGLTFTRLIVFLFFLF